LNMIARDDAQLPRKECFCASQDHPRWISMCHEGRSICNILIIFH
jgi:hypothetical protein